MKNILCLSLLITTQAFAIDFQKVTGTFDVKEKNHKTVGEDTVAAAAYGSFEGMGKSRFPASVNEEAHKTSQEAVTELTGTFK